MNRLEILGNYLNSMISAETIQLEDHKPVGEAAAILLAASKVDVAWLMSLAGDLVVADNFSTLEASIEAEEKLETALRMALAGREWQGLTTEDTMTAIVINQGGEEFVKGLRWAEAKLKEKNAGGTND